MLSREEAERRAREVLPDIHGEDPYVHIANMADTLMETAIETRRQTIEECAKRFDPGGESDQRRGEWSSSDVAEELRALKDK